MQLTNTDNDTGGITVSPTSGLVTTEAGGTATFTAVLTSALVEKAAGVFDEYGADAWDELNLVRPGGNYGWPNCEGTQSRGGSGCSTPGYIAPKRTYATYDASCSGIAIVRDVLYVACLRGERVYRHVISGTTLTNSQELFRGTYGRLRTVEPSRDGGLWLTTTNLGDKDSTANNSTARWNRVSCANASSRSTSMATPSCKSPYQPQAPTTSVPSTLFSPSYWASRPRASPSCRWSSSPVAGASGPKACSTTP